MLYQPKQNFKIHAKKVDVKFINKQQNKPHFQKYVVSVNVVQYPL